MMNKPSFWLYLVPLMVLTTLSPKTEHLRSARFAQSSQSADIIKAAELNVQVRQLFKDQKYKEALPLALQVVDILDRALPADDIRICVALNNLGSTYSALKKYDEAAAAFARALSACDASGKDSATTGDVLHNLGSINSMKHQYEKSDQLLLRAIKLREKMLGPNDPRTIDTMKLFACVDLYAQESKHKLTLDPATDPDYAIKARSVCWLGGFMNDCADDTKVKPDNIVNRKAIKLIAPQYPAQAKRAMLNGSIFIAVLIDEQGDVVQVKPVCGGHPEFVKDSLDAAMHAKFTPITMGNKPVKVTGTIVFQFFAQ